MGHKHEAGEACSECDDPVHAHNKFGKASQQPFADRAINWTLSLPRRVKFALTANLPKAKLYSKRAQDAPWHQPMEKPDWRTVAEASHVRDDDPVLGVHLFGGSWAIPWWIQKNHHVANLDLNGHAVLINLCEACSGSSAFDPMVNGQKLRFRPVGLYNGTILLSDYQTGSYWSPFVGNCLSGKLKGALLKRYPLAQCSWADWKKLHPDTLVPWMDEKMRLGHGAGHAPGQGKVGPGFLKGLEHPLDTRLPEETMVLGIEHAGISRAYPMAQLSQQGAVIYDRLGGQELVILHLPDSFHALAFAAELHGESIRLQMNADGEIVDQDGSRWSYDGECLEGDKLGERLPFLDSWAEEWYGWAASHPETELWQP